MMDAKKKGSFVSKTIPDGSKGAEPHQMAALQPSHMLLFTFSTAMLLALFHLVNSKLQNGFTLLYRENEPTIYSIELHFYLLNRI